MQELIAAGADLNEEDRDGGTVLMWVAAGDQLQDGAHLQAEAQLEAGAHLQAEAHAETHVEPQFNYRNAGPSNMSVEESTTKKEYCADTYGNTADVNSEHETAGVNNSQTGDDMNSKDFMACARLLLAARAEVNLNNQGSKATAMAKSAFYGNCRAVEFLITAGADANATTQDDVTVLIASVMNTEENCEDLMERIGSLYVTEFHRHDTCVELLLAAGADVNAIDAFGTSALMNAATNGYKECVRRLIGAGADVNAKDTTGKTALHFASQRFEIDCADLLLKSGADVNTTCHAGFTALHYFATSNSTHGVNVLLLAGAHVNKTNSEGHNALEHAISSSDPEENMNVLKLLFASGEKLSGREIRHGIFSIPVPEYLLHNDVKLELKHMCREVIRNHVIELSPQQHLFHRIPQLNGEIPTALVNYLLYQVSLEIDHDLEQ